MRLVCIVNAQTPYDGELLEKSAARVGVEIVRYAEGEAWPKDYRKGKMIAALKCIAALPGDVSHVMFVDNSDSLFLAGPEEIVEKFEAIRGDAKVILQGEKNCYPDKALEAFYPPARTPWRFVNSGGWITRREWAEESIAFAASLAAWCDQLCWSMAHLYAELLADSDFRPMNGDPGYQRWGGVLPSVKVDVDENCQIFQSMYLQKAEEFSLENGRLENRVTGGRPCVMHWNGTRNAGVPYSRDGVWEEIAMVSKPKGVRTLCVCTPGSSFSAVWMMEWSGLLLHLSRRFNLRLAGGEGNNIYLVRENVLKQAMGDPNGLPDLILWIDSDNPPTAYGFDMLLAAMDESPEISIIGGWYRFFNPFTKQVYIAAGKRWQNVTEEQIQQAKAEERLMDVDFIGFGFCLMKRQVIDDIGIEHCFEPVRYSENPVTAEEWNPGMRTWSTDDDGFGIRATEKGHKIFLHPGVFAEHEKRLNVPGSFAEEKQEVPILKEA